MGSFSEDELMVTEASVDAIQEIWIVLSEAFAPYYRFYTEKAYSATVITPFEIKNRIQDPETIVLIASCKKRIVGTASIVIKGRNLHIRSMAVKPCYQTKGIGSRILEKICVFSKENFAEIITLECFNPLIEAQKLYKKFCFEFTAKNRILHGIELFEMIK
ncbi:MAG: GNAT family N-acetyltransferase [Promethearchaeota archaeon]